MRLKKGSNKERNTDKDQLKKENRKRISQNHLLTYLLKIIKKQRDN